jgi:hypothetical protein
MGRHGDTAIVSRHRISASPRLRIAPSPHPRVPASPLPPSRHAPRAQKKGETISASPLLTETLLSRYGSISTLMVNLNEPVC